MDRYARDPQLSGHSNPRLTTAVLTAALAAALVAGACTGDATSPAPSSPVSKTTRSQIIPQPEVSGLSVAPATDRVDLRVPTFSDPTDITNTLFPVSSQASVLLLGTVDDQPFRTEVTLLPDTRIIEWQGRRVETLVSQYVAFLGGRIHEVAYDFYAQDDNGAVWYFGEDVFNFADGAIVDTHGTWIAGKDGPPAMIMPVAPAVGDVYRPENIPGFVFEEVTVKAVDQTLEGPLGPVEGGLVIEELHMDGQTEEKTFGPGYGEFYTAGGGDVEALALAVPTDALDAPVPEELVTLQTGAMSAFDSVTSKDWSAASATARTKAKAWTAFRSTQEVPKRLGPRMSRALAELAGGIQDRNSRRARQAAIDVAQWSLDLQLRYRPPVEVDVARFDLWVAQLMVDASAGDAAAGNGDLFTLDYIRDRILRALDPGPVTRLNTRLEELQMAVDDGDLRTAAQVAAKLRKDLAGVMA
jgi:hypothetical protein